MTADTFKKLGDTTVVQRFIFTAEDKRKEAEREVAMRVRVYGHYVLKGKMTPVEADRKIALMKANVEDLKEIEAKGRLL